MLNLFHAALQRRQDEGRLFGRDVEISKLQQVYQQVQSGKKAPQAVWVHGYSGSGKSCLVERTFSKKKGAIFCFGKYDQVRSGRPYSALMDACRGLLSSIHEQQKNDDKRKVVSCLEESLRNDFQLLVGLIPELADLLPKHDRTNNERGISSAPGHFQFDRLKSALQMLLSGICKVCPVIMFIDDLQWADAASLNILTYLLASSSSSQSSETSSPLKHFLFLGAYRDNELTGAHPLLEPILQLEALDCSTKIHVTDLDRESLNIFIADLLNFEDDPSMIQNLSKSVHERTHGNIFFVIQFLDMLVTANILYFSVAEEKWRWDETKLRSKTESTDNVVDLVIEKMQRLPQKAATAMLVASQLGSRFNSQIVESMVGSIEGRRLLQQASSTNDGETKQEDEGPATDEARNIYEIPVKDGFIVPLAPHSYWYRFCHDRIQQGAEGLGGTQQQLNELRYEMGQLLHQLSQDGAPWKILKTADLLNLSSALIVGEGAQENNELIRLNLEAAKISSHQSAFGAASEYLTKCQSLMGENKWESDQYALTLKVLTLAAEVEFCRGSSTNCRRLVNEIRQHAVCLEDKLQAIYILIKSLGSEAHYDESIGLAYETVNQAGFSMPIGGAQPKDIEIIFGRSIKKLNEIPNVEILNMEEDVMNKTREICLKILVSLILFAWHANRLLDHAMVSCTLMLNTLDNGLSEFSGIGFAVFGVCSAVNMEIAISKRMYTLVTSPIIQNRYTGKEIEGATTCVCYAGSGHLCLPFANVAQEFLSGYQSAMKAGVVEWGVADCGLYLIVYFISGLPLPVFEADSHVFISQMIQYENHIHRPICELYLQVALNLMGKGCSDPISLDGEALKAYDVSKILDGTLPNFPCQVGYFAQLMLAYYFGDFKLATELADKHEAFGAAEWPLAWSIPHPFFRGLSYLALARQSQVSKTGGRKKKKSGFLSRLLPKRRNSVVLVVPTLLEKAQTQAELIRTYVRHEMINAFHMLKILEAEVLTLDPKAKVSDVKDAYLSAIRVSRRAGYLQDAALAAERYAEYLSTVSKDSPETAAEFFFQAVSLYRQWGATGKAMQLEQHHKKFLEHASVSFSVDASGHCNRSQEVTSIAIRAKPHEAVTSRTVSQMQIELTGDQND